MSKSFLFNWMMASFYLGGALLSLFIIVSMILQYPFVGIVTLSFFMITFVATFIYHKGKMRDEQEDLK